MGETAGLPFFSGWIGGWVGWTSGHDLNKRTPRSHGGIGFLVPLKKIEYGFGYVVLRSPYTPYSTYLGVYRL